MRLNAIKNAEVPLNDVLMQNDKAQLIICIKPIKSKRSPSSTGNEKHAVCPEHPKYMGIPGV